MSDEAPSSSRTAVPEHPRSRPGLVFRELAEEWVLFDPDARLLHVMNLTAALVWSHCDGEHTTGEIVRAVAEAYDDPPADGRLEDDVREALEAFARKGLLREEGAGA